MNAQQTTNQTVNVNVNGISFKELKKIVNEFENLQGAKFVSFRNYKADNKGIYNYILNMNVNLMNAKKKDLECYKNISNEQIKNFADMYGMNVKECFIGFSELLSSAEKNVNPDIKKRTTASQTQTNTYIVIGKGIKVHKEKGTIHFFGQIISREVIKEGEKKVRNYKTDRTKFKDLFPFSLDLKTKKIRNLRLDRINSIKLNGNTLIFE